jgi:DNA-binding beta-propeller fold protein YncE
VAAVDADTIQVFDTASFQVTAAVPTGNSPTSVSVAPDGRHAYVTNLKDGTLTILDVGA